MPLTAALLLSVLPRVVFAVPPPMITPPPALTAQHLEILEQKRDIFSDVNSYVDSVVSGLGSDVSSYIASGVPQFFADLPTGTAVMSKLGLSDSDIAPLPTQVLNVPAYANWTDQGWNVRVHGNVYKVPNLTESKLNSLANIFLIGTDITDLPGPQQTQARNLTSEIFVVQQKDVNVTVTFANDVAVEPQNDGGAINAAGGAQSIQLPYSTTAEGDFDAWLTLANTSSSSGGHMLAGNATTRIQTLNMYINGTDTGNATAYLVPPTGITVVSDIDDILRVTKIWDPKEGLLNSFARPFTPWLNMPEIYSNWSTSLQDFHFHYLTTTPEQVTRNYMDFIFKTYPLGSFDTRPLNFSDVNATLAIRKSLLNKIFQTFPQRKFIVVGDTSNSDIMSDYPQLAKDYPNQLLCILLRNSSSTDSTDKFPYDTSGFQGLPQNQYMFFNVPDDLRGLDIANGQCYNSSVRQNVTFSQQGLPFGLSKSAGTVVARPGVATSIVGVLLFAGFSLLF
ncbi:hypothetical protein QBC46DRAFT_248036 [Diplogelasinospora grovesii]|uniref:Phosphatidate phosphatase APP1 catalytic domain-containing protein n=1 Tax=Diplogelasinospora grovesii TaxID=303347 RepID=A0AAN6NJG6_9PEZI|nr:hypothetical protein QBC46DRAFT_248036 [Diplogelasinospora grovesii]